ncbi:NAD-dependent epimerase/dehydratase family protein [Ruania halotolerans]|uniref:NAD-dependent epimerase/dehydratase family protein n=1 Tax=Ruania halotolerans TaxID=2897773 RepID=UPI001E2E9F1D|nr:NAD-dependent epimerase/dehydratase family protein [Ruania halotolerans]UFU06425.1 NAD-dependent epimerase/dehydratase family protein [Ruania halotolerans]
MSRIVVIGGSGHVGTYLVPRLVEAGHQVVNVSRGAAAPYTAHAAWDRVERVVLDRDAAEQEGAFGAAIAALEPDVVVDLICFTLDSARELVEALRGRVQHLLHCGTIWVYGHNATVPATEDQPLNPFGDYGTQKAAIETYLLDEARRTGFPATVVRPGHISGPGWVPLNPAGHFDPEVFSLIARGDELVLPNFGLETVHHVHADDVAQIFERAIHGWGAAVGEAFNAVSPQAVNLRGYAEHMYRWFGREPRIEFQPFEQWRTTQEPGDVEATLDHIGRSPSHSIEKARRLLGHVPRYSTFATIEEAVTRLIADGRVHRD